MSGRIKLGLVGTVLLTLALPCLAQTDTDLLRLREENLRLKQALLEQEKKLLEHEKRMQDLRDKAIAAEIAAKTMRERLLQVTEKMEEMQQDLARLRALGQVNPAKAERSPPPEKVEGLVKEVEEKTGLMTLNIGSDSGLQKGHTLEVYRLDKDPAKSIYLGTVRLLEVVPTEAVGRMIAKPRAPVQKGDRVASKIGP